MKKVKLRPIINDHAERKFTCGWEMGSNEFSWSGLIPVHELPRALADTHVVNNAYPTHSLP